MAIDAALERDCVDVRRLDGQRFVGELQGRLELAAREQLAGLRHAGRGATSRPCPLVDAATQLCGGFASPQSHCALERRPRAGQVVGRERGFCGRETLVSFAFACRLLVQQALLFRGDRGLDPLPQGERPGGLRVERERFLDGGTGLRVHAAIELQPRRFIAAPSLRVHSRRRSFSSATARSRRPRKSMAEGNSGRSASYQLDDLPRFAEALRLEVRRGLGELRLDSTDLLRFRRRCGRHPDGAAVRRGLKHQSVAGRRVRRLGLDALTDARDVTAERRQVLISALGDRARDTCSTARSIAGSRPGQRRDTGSGESWTIL